MPEAPSLVSRLRGWLPRGSTLPQIVWERRNALMGWIMWSQVVGLAAFGFAQGFSALTVTLAILPIVVCALVARSRRPGRMVREVATTLGLLTCSAVLAAFWGGVVEAHFAFFVIVALLATYESWVPFLLAFVYVALHHGVFGSLWPHLVFRHDGDPWLWAGVHAGFIGALGLICLMTWRLAEDQRDEFRAAFDRAPMGVALVDDDGVIIRGNRALAQRAGVEAIALDGIPLTRFLVADPDDADWPYETAAAVERRFVDHQGNEGWGLWQFSRVGIDAWVMHVQDITLYKRAQRDLSWQANHDSLTGLPNRALFEERLRGALDRRRAGRTSGHVAVLFVDLDDFKVVNDSLGHEAGDRLLTVVAERLRNVVRPQDVIARFGGDEFTVLLADVADEDEARRITDRLAAALSDPIVLDGQRRYVTASIGLSMGEDADSEALLRDADAAMYRAKETGKARMSVFDAPMRQAAVERLELETALRGAVERDELRLVFQPVVSLPSGRVGACEALLRWDHPTLGRVAPDRFIGLAEQTGVIVAMGAWVLREACRVASDWPEHVGVSVNVSARQLGTTDLPDVVADALDASGLAPERLCLEITETALLADGEALGGTLAALKGLGVRLAIDDFGVGHASLMQLRRLLPVDTLKIDKSFVDGIVSDAEDSAIVAGVVRLAHSLGLVAVAEGVEHAEQADILASMGCQSAQGYLFARPQEAAVIAELLTAEPAAR